jgi:hypothetical protein
MHTCMQVVPLEGGILHITLLYYFTLKYSMVLEFLHGINWDYDIKFSSI